jgi:nucleotide-binding universal stress UspA family protein
VTGTWGDGDTAAPRRIVVPLDGSDTGARAQPLGHALAGRLGAEVVTVHVGGDPHVRVDVHLDGDPADALLDHARSHPGTLLCLSSHGRSGLRRVLLGSVAERVVREATTPVLVVGPEVRIAPPIVLPRTIVIAVGSLGDPHGVSSLGERWAALLDADVAKVHVGDPTAEAPAGVRVLGGDDPVPPLLALADELEGPLLYTVAAPAPEGTRTGRPVSLRLLREARGPVLTQARRGGPS